jgi:hypothetical protein
VVLFTFSHRITSDRLHSLHTHLHHPRFQGSSLLFLFLFLFLFSPSSLFGLYAASLLVQTATGRNLTPFSISTLVPPHLPSLSSISRPLLWRHNTIVPYSILDSRSHLPDSLDSQRLIPLQVPVTPATGLLPSHPVVQAQPNFKLDLKCLSLLNWHFKIT